MKCQIQVFRLVTYGSTSCVRTVLANRPIISMCPCQLGLELGRAGTTNGIVPSRELTYPTWGKLNIIFKSVLKKGTCYIIPRRVYIYNIHMIHVIYIYIDLYWGLSKVMCFVFNPIARLFTVFSNMRLTLCCFMPISKHVFNLKPPHLPVLIWLSVANARGRLCTQFRPEFSHIWRCSSWGIATASC